MKRHWTWPLFLTLAITLASGTSRLAVPEVNFQLISKDKLAHFLIFGLLATSIIRIPKINTYGWVGVSIAIFSTAAFGGFDELRQSLTPGRSVEFADWIADTLGALVAAIIYFKWSAYRKVLEWKPGKRTAVQPKKALAAPLK